MRDYYRCYSIVPWLIGYIFLLGIIVYLLFCLHKADKEVIELKQKITYYESCRDIRDAIEKVHQWEDEMRHFNSDWDLNRPR